VFDGWPDSFYEFIDLKRSQAGKLRAHYMKTHFGEFYEDLFRNPRLTPPEFNFFRDSFKSYLELYWDGRPVRRVTPKLKHITKMEAIAQLDISEKWFRRYVSEGRLIAIVRPGLSQARTFIDAESVRRLKEEIGGLVLINVVAKALGIGNQVVRDLVHAGCIVPVRGPNIDGFGRLMFDKDAAKNLMSRLESRLADNYLPPSRSQDLRNVVNRFSPMNACFANKVKAILDGILLPLK
jgi:predicted site-specific integrase-resolvase